MCIRLFRHLLYLFDGEVRILLWKNLHILVRFLVSCKALESFFFLGGGGSQINLDIFFHLCTLCVYVVRINIVVKMHFSERGELCSYSGGSDQLTDRTEGAKATNRCSTRTL